MDRTEEDTPNVMKDHEETAKLSLHSQPFKQGSGPDHGERVLGEKITVWLDPSPYLLGSSVNYFECLGWKTKIENCNQFSIITLPLKTEKLSHATDLNVVGKAKFPLCFISLFIVDRIKLKI